MKLDLSIMQVDCLLTVTLELVSAGVLKLRYVGVNILVPKIQAGTTLVVFIDFFPSVICKIVFT